MYLSSKSVLFNGTTQYATGGNVLDFERNQAFSVAGWFKSTTTASANLVAKEGDGSPSTPEGWGIELKGDSSGQLRFVMVYTWATNCIGIDTVSGGFNDGLWHHFAVVFDGVTYPSSASAVVCYVDGALETMASPLYDNLVNNVSNPYDFTLARRENTSSRQYFDGNLDELTIYSGVLSAADVLWLFNAGNTNDPKHANAPSGLTSWWKMGEDQIASTIPDQQASNDLTLMNTAATVEDAPSGDRYDSTYLATPHWPLYTTTPEYAPEYDSTYLVPPHWEVYTFKEELGDVSFGPTPHFKMRAVDSNQTSPPRYITWIVPGQPDFDGDYYNTLGVPTPVGSMVPGSAVVVSEWEE